MKAKKKPVEIEFYPCELEYLDDIMEWSTDERPIIIEYMPNFKNIFL